jgi:hypothetical protein
VRQNLSERRGFVVFENATLNPFLVEKKFRQKFAPKPFSIQKRFDAPK